MTGHGTSRASQIGIHVGVAVLTVVACLAWFGYHRGSDPSSAQILGLSLTIAAVIAVGCCVSGSSKTVANSASASFTFWWFLDVATGPSPEFALVIPMFYGPAVWAAARLVALPFGPDDAAASAADLTPAADSADPPTTDSQIAAWRAYRDSVIRRD